jgi:hypothetical protein
MARKLSGREKFMVGALAVAAVVFYRWQSGAIGFGAPPANATAEVTDFGEPPVVHMDLLALNMDGFGEDGRNLFDYYTPPRKPAPKPPPQVVVRPTVVRDKKPPPPPPPPRKQGPPAPTFHYLGFLGPKESRIAAFDAGEGVFIARAGDVVPDTKFRLKSFRHEAVVLEYLHEQFKGQTTELQLKGVR